jgi:hypothetical protein
MPKTKSDTRLFFDELSSLLADAAAIGETKQDGDVLICHAIGTVEEAHYRVEVEEDRIWVSMVTKDRWLSESIEADLMNSGDKLEELIDDELADLGAADLPVSFEHFRSDDMFFTFRSPIEIPQAGLSEAAKSTSLMLLAYVACFEQLGDVGIGSDDD